MGASKRATPAAPASEPVVDETISAGNDAPVAEPAPETPVETPAVAKGSVTVNFRGENGMPTERTFSKEVHGADFAKSAKEFSENLKSQGRLLA